MQEGNHVQLVTVFWLLHGLERCVNGITMMYFLLKFWKIPFKAIRFSLPPPPCRRRRSTESEEEEEEEEGELAQNGKMEGGGREGGKWGNLGKRPPSILPSIPARSLVPFGRRVVVVIAADRRPKNDRRQSARLGGQAGLKQSPGGGGGRGQTRV